MGKVIVNRMKRMGWIQKISLVTVLTFLLSIVLYQGWYSPRRISAGSAQVTKAYTFNTTSESWAGLFGAATTGTSASGYLTTTIAGRKKTDATAGWEINGITWESLGVPAGATVVSVDGSYSWYCSNYNLGASSNSGALTITDATDGNIATLESGVAFTSTTTSATRNATGATAIPAAIQASNSAIQVKLLGSLATGNDGAASVTRVSDNVSLIINYTYTSPVLTLPTAATIASTTATLGATVSSNGGNNITDYGIVWNTAGAPTLANSTIVQKGTTNFTGTYTSNVTGLPAAVRVYYAGYATNANGTSYTTTGSFYTEPATQAANVQFTTVTANSMTISWTNGSGDGALVLMKAASAVTGAPADGTYTYTASTTYGSGTLVGDGYTIYKGSGSTVSVTGLTGGTTYHVSVFASAGTSTTSGVNIGTNYVTTTPATGSALAQNTAPIIGAVTVNPISSTYTSPAPAVSAPVTLASGSPSGCEYTTDGSSWFPANLTGSSSPWTCSAALTGLSGSKSFNIRATSIGGTGTGSPVVLSVDANLPVISSQSPADGASLIKENVLLGGEATDIDSGVDSYKITIFDATHTLHSDTGWMTYTGPISYAPVGLAYGAVYYWNLSIKDKVGNVVNADERIFSTKAACFRNEPTVSLATTGDAISAKILVDAGSAAYRLRVRNNDVGGCGDTLFNLSAANTFNPVTPEYPQDDTTKFNSPSLGVSNVTVAPGTYQDVTVTVSAVSAGGADVTGVAKTTVTTAAAAHTNVTSNEVLTVLNVAGCTKNAALLTIGPDVAYATRGGSTVYTVSVKNTDYGANCSAANFTVSKISDSIPANFSSSLSETLLTLKPGQAKTVYLTVASNSSVTQSTSNVTSVGVSEATHPATGNKTATTTIGDQKLHNSDNLASTKWGAAGWGVPGGRYGEFVCNTCHVPGGLETGNVKRMREMIFTPYTGTHLHLPGEGKRIALTKIKMDSGAVPNAADASFGWDATTTKLTEPLKVCEACHTYDASKVNGVKFHGLTGTAQPSHYDGQDCIRCHKHNAGFGLAGMNCNFCHGDSTVETQPTADNRYVVAPPKNSAALTGTVTGTGQVSNDPKVGAHQTHVRYLNGFSNYSTYDYRCQGCHGTLPTDYAHMDGSSPMAFQGLATGGGMSPSFSSSNLTCSNTYCHNPAGTGGTLAAANAGSAIFPSWTSSGYIADGARKTQSNCNRCHKVPGDAGFSFQGTHGAEMVTNEATDCAICHGHNGDTSGVVGQRHIDGNRSAAGGHEFPYPGAVHATLAGTTPWSGCTGCHTNGSNTTYPVESGFKPDCTGCHKRPANETTYGLRTPDGTSSCYDCHGASATDGRPNGSAFPNYSGSHTKHVVAQSMTCANCHGPYGGGSVLNDSRHGFSNRTAHDITFVNVTSTTAQFSYSATGQGSCSNISCHGSAEWGVTKLDCSSCHSYDTVDGTWGSNTHLDGLTAEGWGAHAAHIDKLKVKYSVTLNATTDTYGSANFNLVCGACHSQLPASHTMNNSSKRLINFNGSNTYQFGPSAVFYNGSTGKPSSTQAKTCSNISCHFGAAPQWQ